MTTKHFFILILFADMTSCNNAGNNNVTSDLDCLIASKNSLINKLNETAEINCDSIYKNRGFSIKLISLVTTIESDTENMFIFLVNAHQGDQNSEIFRDTIQSTVQEVKFIDFNNDSVKDILIQNSSDVRSNWTYYLYIVDKNNDLIRKIKGFEAIKNPNYITKYDLIDNLVMSGRNWTSFYKINGDSILDFNIVIYDGEDENGNVTYDTEYKKAINKILTN
jgi:hypothetical protein